MNELEVGTDGKVTGEAAPKEETLWHPDSVRQRRGLAAVVRLAALNGTGKYILGGGGKNPASPTPHTWVGGVYGSDCIGAVMWALQHPRFDPGFPEYGGWINCDSAMMDAAVATGGKGLGKYFRYVPRTKVYPGCICIFPSIRAHEIGPEYVKKYGLTHRCRIGHVGLVAGWEGLVNPEAAFVESPADGAERVVWDGKLTSLMTVECCGSSPAIRFRRNVNFTDHALTFAGKTNEAWGVKFLEYVGP